VNGDVCHGGRRYLTQKKILVSISSPSGSFGSRTPLALAIHLGHAAREAVLRAHGAPE
jgi:hypothetical protein